jgi:hypothetical protein
LFCRVNQKNLKINHTISPNHSTEIWDFKPFFYFTFVVAREAKQSLYSASIPLLKIFLSKMKNKRQISRVFIYILRKFHMPEYGFPDIISESKLVGDVEDKTANSNT